MTQACGRKVEKVKGLWCTDSVLVHVGAAVQRADGLGEEEFQSEGAAINKYSVE